MFASFSIATLAKIGRISEEWARRLHAPIDFPFFFFSSHVPRCHLRENSSINFPVDCFATDWNFNLCLDREYRTVQRARECFSYFLFDRLISLIEVSRSSLRGQVWTCCQESVNRARLLRIDKRFFNLFVHDSFGSRISGRLSVVSLFNRQNGCQLVLVNAWNASWMYPVKNKRCFVGWRVPINSFGTSWLKGNGKFTLTLNQDPWRIFLTHFLLFQRDESSLVCHRYQTYYSLL